MSSDHPVGPTSFDWANANLSLVRVETDNPHEPIYRLLKRLVINGIEHIQYVWINQHQLRSIGIDHGL